MSAQGWVCIDCAAPEKLCRTTRSVLAENESLRALVSELLEHIDYASEACGAADDFHFTSNCLGGTCECGYVHLINRARAALGEGGP
jgi:hypothetical protein